MGLLLWSERAGKRYNRIMTVITRKYDVHVTPNAARSSLPQDMDLHDLIGDNGNADNR
jgi:hypothetical protein